MYGQLHRILLLAPVFLIAVSATSRALLEADIAADAVLGASGDVMGSEYGDSAGSYGDGDIMFMDGGYGQVTMADMSDDVVPPSPGEYGEAGAAGYGDTEIVEAPAPAPILTTTSIDTTNSAGEPVAVIDPLVGLIRGSPDGRRERDPRPLDGEREREPREDERDRDGSRDRDPREEDRERDPREVAPRSRDPRAARFVEEDDRDPRGVGTRERDPRRDDRDRTRAPRRPRGD